MIEGKLNCRERLALMTLHFPETISEPLPISFYSDLWSNARHTAPDPSCRSFSSFG